MTPVAGALTITWVNQYVGPHRICYRLGLVGSYTCITVNSPNPPGSSNSTIIPVLVDNESCDTIEWDVYVQAECEDINSVTGRVYVAPIPTFVPSPTCLPQLFTCTSVELIGFTITDPGTDYTGVEAATVGGDPATLTIGVGDPNSLLISNPGAGALTDGPYLGVATTTLTGVGVGATVDLTITGGVVAAVTSLGTGSGYVAGDTFEIDITGIPGLAGLAGDVITAVTVDTGTVIAINFVPSVLYAAPPAVVIDPPNPGPGVTATATAILGNCPSGWDAGNNCLAAAYGIYPTEVAQGETFELCYDGGAYDGPDDLPTDFGLVLTAGAECCYDCVDVTFTNNTGDTVSYTYVDCATKSLQTDTLADSANITIDCVVNGSWSFDTPGVTIATNSPGTC